jgi:cytosine/adenosine deaminase-related metal-dependent hydrolase
MIIKDPLVVTPRSDAPVDHLDVKLASIGIEDGIIRAEPLRISMGEAWHVATLGGARAFGMERRIGSIAEGKDADIVLLKSPAAIDPDLFARSEDGERRPEKSRIVEQLFTRNVLRKEHIDKVIVHGRVIVDGGILVSRGHEAAIMKRLAKSR